MTLLLKAVPEEIWKERRRGCCIDSWSLTNLEARQKSSHLEEAHGPGGDEELRGSGNGFKGSEGSGDWGYASGPDPASCGAGTGSSTGEQGRYAGLQGGSGKVATWPGHGAYGPRHLELLGAVAGGNGHMVLEGVAQPKGQGNADWR